MAHTAPEVTTVSAYMPPARVPVTLVARHEAMRRREILVIREALHQEVRTRRHELVWTTGTPTSLAAPRDTLAADEHGRRVKGS